MILNQWKASFYDLGDKRKIETEAVGDTSKRISEVFRGLEKTLAVRYYIGEGYFEAHKILIDK